MRQLLRVLAAASLSVTLVVLVGAGPAAADTPPAATGCTTPTYVDPATAGQVIGGGCQSWPDGHDLPVLRWAGAATSLHWKSEGGITKVVSDMATWLQRDGTWPVFMTVGNTMWSWATAIVSFGVRAQPLVAAGAAVDSAVAKIGDALTTSGLVAFLVAVAVVVMLWRTYRQHRFPWAQAGRIVLVVGLLVAMTAGAARSTTDANGNYAPGVMSPGWTVNLINRTISTLASAPAAVLDLSDWSADPGGSGSLADVEGSCKRYVDAMVEQYQSGAKGDGVIMSSITVSMSRMWQQTGLEAWKTAQFGAGNPYRDVAYCRLLEMRSQVPASEQIALSTAKSTFPPANTGSGAWGTGDDDVALDQSLVAWAACRPTADGSGWQVASDWDQVERTRGAVTADACAKWWSDNFFVGVDYRAAAAAYLAANPDGFHVGGSICAPGAYNGTDCWTTKDLGWTADATAEAMAWGGACEYSKWNTLAPADCWYVEDDGSTRLAGQPICTLSTGNSCLDQASEAVGGILKDDNSPFFWSGSANGAINETGSAPSARNFLLALHGSSNIGGTLATTLTYAIASVVVMVTFGMLGIGVFVAKLWALVVMVSLFFTLLRDVIFTNEPSATVKLFRQYLGISFFAFGLQLVFALVTLFTGVLVAMGADWFEPGSATSMAWLAMAPAVSVFVLHTVFTKTLKLPSPFTVNGVKTWGSAAAGGAVGGAVGAGLGRMMMGPLRQTRSAISRNVSSAALSRLGLARGERARRAGAFTAGAAGAAGADVGRPRRRGRLGPQAGEPVGSGTGTLAASTGAPPAGRRAAEPEGAVLSEPDALLDGDEVSSDARARAELRQGAEGRAREARERRGYGGGIAGDAREALTERHRQRMGAVQAQFRAKPVRASLGVAAKVAGGAGLVVGTAGLALPVMAASFARREVTASQAARRAAVTDFRARQAAQRAAAAAAANTATREQGKGRPDPRVRVQPPSATRPRLRA